MNASLSMYRAGSIATKVLSDWIRLDWALEGLENEKTSTPFTTLYAPPKRKKDAQRMAALLMSQDRGAEAAVPVLSRWLVEEVDDSLLEPLAKGLFNALLISTERVKLPPTALEKLVSNLPPEKGPLIAAQVKMLNANYTEAWEALGEQDDLPADVQRLQLLRLTGQRDRAISLLEERLASGRFPPEFRNDLAWFHLFGDKEELETARKDAARASKAAPQNLGILHTLATAEALLGNLDAAAALRVKAAQLKGRADQLDPSWFLIEGLILHGLERFEDAAVAFAKVPEPALPNLRFENRDLIPARYR